MSSIIFIFCHLKDIRKTNKEKFRLEEEEARLRAAGEWVSEVGDEDAERLNPQDAEPKPTSSQAGESQAGDVESNLVNIEESKPQENSEAMPENSQT